MAGEFRDDDKEERVQDGGTPRCQVLGCRKVGERVCPSILPWQRTKADSLSPLRGQGEVELSYEPVGLDELSLIVN